MQNILKRRLFEGCKGTGTRALFRMIVLLGPGTGTSSIFEGTDRHN